MVVLGGVLLVVVVLGEVLVVLVLGEVLDEVLVVVVLGEVLGEVLVVVVLVLAEVHALASMQVCTVQQVLFDKLISLDGLIFFTCTVVKVCEEKMLAVTCLHLDHKLEPR